MSHSRQKAAPPSHVVPAVHANSGARNRDEAAGAPSPELALPRMVGNQAVTEALQQTQVGPTASPSVSKTGDRFEQEAESAASRVTAKSNLEAQPARLHRDATAAAAARALRADAFTVGRDIFFAAGKYQPGTSAGRELLSHELVHVAQNESGASTAGTPTIMRKPSIPSAKEAESEVADLRTKLTELQEEEQREGKSLPETAGIAQRLQWREAAAVATNPDRREILYRRGRLRELRRDLKAAPPSSQKEEITKEIRGHESALVAVLKTEIVRLEAEVRRLRDERGSAMESNPDRDRALADAEAELIEDQQELEISSRVFTPEKAAVVAEKYKKEVRPLPGGGCMTAVYKGIEALYSKDESAAIKTEVQRESAKVLKRTKVDTNSMDRIVETLRSHAMAGPEIDLKFDARADRWTPGLESTVLSKVNSDHPGWYFFGLSVSGAYHSVILAVDNAEGGAPKIYWMDQYAKGFSKNVTGRLDAELKDWKPSYGYATTKVWPLLPTEKNALEVE